MEAFYQSYIILQDVTPFTSGLRVTEDALDRWSWPEAGEAVGVPEVSVCLHPAIMPDFQTP
jgi:hypothetical protein